MQTHANPSAQTISSSSGPRRVRRWLPSNEDLPPGPQGLPVVGMLHRIGGDPLEFLPRLVKQYGTFSYFRIGPQRIYLVAEPDIIEDVLLKNARSFVKDRITRYLSVALGEGLLVSEGEHWKRQRRLIAPAVRKSHIASYADDMVRRTREYTDRLGGDQTRDIHSDMMALTMEIVSDTLFGADVQTDAHEVGESLETMMGEFVKHVRSWRRFLPDWVPTRGMRTVQSAIARLDELMMRIIAERRASGDYGDDMLSLLLAARDEDGSQMDDRQIRDEALTMFVAGHETTALALTFALRFVSEHPDVYKSLLEEIDTVSGGQPLTADHVRQLRMTNAVVQETLRLYPPAWAVAREATEDVQLGDYRAPKGSVVLTPMWVVHRDPRFWQDPETFRPERWLNGETDDLPRFAFFPFGGGPRTCIGNHFATMELILVVATLLQQRDWRWLDGEPDLLAAVTLRPTTPMRARTSPR